ncbi:hypothetical protein L1276_000998 [Flavobacterium sp. HSC-32F16]|nr:hypothetical protein [Flavobacterium sp. HSC-32F16]
MKNVFTIVSVLLSILTFGQLKDNKDYQFMKMVKLKASH